MIAVWDTSPINYLVRIIYAQPPYDGHCRSAGPRTTYPSKFIARVVRLDVCHYSQSVQKHQRP